MGSLRTVLVCIGSSFGLLLSVLLISLPASSENVLSGSISLEQVNKLTTEISWYKNLSKAEEAANREHKLVLWVHMIGKIDGAT